MKLKRRDDGGTDNRTARALAGTKSPRHRAKLLKKLRRKQEFEKIEDEDGPQSRRKRFRNPEMSFGKSSLVYQLKYGALKDEVPADRILQPVRPREQNGDGPRRSTWVREDDIPTAKQERERRALLESTSSDKHRPQASSRARADNGPSRQDKQRQPVSDSRNSREIRPQRRHEESASSEKRTRDTRDVRPRGERDSADFASTARRMMPMSIKYTTAASQFLYGRSVVKAALEQSRRKLYNLYVYGGENRVDSHYNGSMIRLAKSQGIPVTIVPNDQQRLMDKMSMGRPHNGFVLETSPLPQIPVTSLGKVEGSLDRYGFHIERAHQTREEETVNGTNSFIKRQGSRTPMPLVLLLHEILDPGNLGALLRTASYLGIDAVGITNRSSSTLTPVVLKSAAGAVEEITIFSVDSPADFITRSQNAGWTAYAAVAPPEGKLARMHESKFVSTDDIEENSPLLHSPSILVLGNEGHGLPRQVKVAADYELSIPRVVQDSCIDSLNVSVAGALLCHSFIKGCRTKSTPAIQANPFAATEPAEVAEEVEKAEDATEEKVERLF